MVMLEAPLEASRENLLSKYFLWEDDDAMEGIFGMTLLCRLHSRLSVPLKTDRYM